MNSPDEPSEPAHDFGEVVKSRRLPAVWAWIFPVLAAAAATWLFWTNWKSEGPEIRIHFEEAPGIQAGKTLLIYRGVTSGKVTRVHLDSSLKRVVVTVRLQAFAEGLARKDTDFWIDQPVISLRETSGLESIIQGNSIQARERGGPPAREFQGLSRAPLVPLDAPSLVLNLQAAEIPFLARGTPIYHRGVQVGYVQSKEIDAQGVPFLQAIVNEEHVRRVRSNSRFWALPASSLKLSARGVTVDMAGLDAFVQGGIAFDHFAADGADVEDERVFTLSPNEFAARADGPPLLVSFRDGRGLVAGQTKVTCLGQPVGLVERLDLDLGAGAVLATVRLEAPYVHLAGEGAKFTLIRPQVSLHGITGLETLLTGPYLALDPGEGAPATSFVGRSLSEEEWDRVRSGKASRRIALTAKNLPNISAGAPVLHRGLVAGIVREKGMDASGNPCLHIELSHEFRDALHENSRFWRVPATSVSAGPGVLNIEVQGLTSLVSGGVAFDDFGAPGGQAGDTYPLFDSERAAAATSPPVKIVFSQGQGLLAGRSQLRHLGVPVGLVESVRTANGNVEVVARFEPGHEALRRKGAKFAIVQPVVSLQGITGMETILSGVYIDCMPGTGPTADSFVGKASGDPEVLDRTGFEIRLLAPASGIHVGAHVYYRSTTVGVITDKNLTEDGQQVELTAVIEPKYRHLIRENSRFWDDSQIVASVGFVKLKIQAQTLISPDGRVAFSNPDKPGDPAKPGQVFVLGKRLGR